MRLDEFDPNSVNVEDQRGSGGRGFPVGRGGQVGCGTLVVALVLAYFLGVDPGQMLGGLQQVAPQEQSGGPVAGTNASESCKLDQASLDSCNALSSLNKTWQPLFAAANIRFQPPGLVFYRTSARRAAVRRKARWGRSIVPRIGKSTSTPIFTARWTRNWAPPGNSPATM